VETDAKRDGAHAVPVANPVVVLREEFDDWAVLYNPDTAEAVGINPVGVAVWKLLDGRRTVDAIVAAVRERFADVPAGAPAEIAAFLERLAAGGFVGSVEGNPGG
jgi:SynChlorMet cassette protein ScmD